MKVYDAQNIRNIGLFGHAGSGKTILAESMLYQAGMINRRGTIEDNNTVSDYNEIEHEKGSSIFSTLLNAEYKNNKINIIDTPGYDDYIGEVVSAVKVVDTGIIVINAHSGIEVGTENGWEYTEKANKPVVFVVNKLDVDQADFNKTADELNERFGHSVTVLQYPLKSGPGFDSIIDILTMSMYKFKADTNSVEKLEIPADQKENADSIRNELIDSIAETDEELMNKYFEEGKLTDEELSLGLKKAIINREIFPVLCASSKHNIGSQTILDFVANVLPSPLDVPKVKDTNGNDISCDANAKPVLFVFKQFSEAHLGDMTYFRVYSGKVNTSDDLYNFTWSASERLGQLFAINGKKRDELPTITAGDLGATVKLKNTHINDTLHTKGSDIEIPQLQYPNPKVRVAIEPVTKGEEEKVGMGLNALHSEDPSLIIEHSQELRQMIIHAQGELHLGVTKRRLETRFKVETKFIDPRVPYRETIQKMAQGSYRHKKQSGGAGQFAEVHMRVEPYFEGAPNPEALTVRGKDLHSLNWGGHLEYINCIVGGVIDQRFLPAILKGIMDKMERGPLTGSYVRDVRVSIYDGKMHPVDSNEAAFKTAGMMAFKDTFKQAAPKILEPIYNIQIKVPEEFVGDVMSDLPGRRGIILGIDSEGRYQKINARMPLAELDKYSTALRSMTQARATYSSEFAEYQTVPPNVQQELIDAYKKQQEEDE